MRLWWLGFAASFFGCGGGWGDSDTKSASDAVRTEAMALTLCADVDAASACVPSHVRALERAALCANESMLVRHGHALDAGGVQCTP